MTRAGSQKPSTNPFQNCVTRALCMEGRRGKRRKWRLRDGVRQTPTEESVALRDSKGCKDAYTKQINEEIILGFKNVLAFFVLKNT